MTSGKILRTVKRCVVFPEQEICQTMLSSSCLLYGFVDVNPCFFPLLSQWRTRLKLLSTTIPTLQRNTFPKITCHPSLTMLYHHSQLLSQTKTWQPHEKYTSKFLLEVLSCLSLHCLPFSRYIGALCGNRPHITCKDGSWCVTLVLGVK